MTAQAPPAVSIVSTGDGIDLRVLDWGGAGEPVVLLHPNGFCAGLYEPIARLLRPVARPIAIDLRGHGGSSSPLPVPASYSVEAMAGDVVAALDRLGLRHVPVVGGSLGGGVAVLVDRLDPGRWQRLLLAEAIALPPSWTRIDRPNPMAEAARRRRPTFVDLASMRAAYAGRPPLSQLAPEALDAYLRWGTVSTPDGVALACDPLVEAAVFEASVGPGGGTAVWDHLARLASPVTILKGSDTMLPDVFTEQADRAGGRLVVVPGGHFVLHEDTRRGAMLILEHALAT